MQILPVSLVKLFIVFRELYNGFWISLVVGQSKQKTYFLLWLLSGKERIVKKNFSWISGSGVHLVIGYYLCQFDYFPRQAWEPRLKSDLKYVPCWWISVCQGWSVYSHLSRPFLCPRRLVSTNSSLVLPSFLYLYWVWPTYGSGRRVEGRRGVSRVLFCPRSLPCKYWILGYTHLRGTLLFTHSMVTELYCIAICPQGCPINFSEGINICSSW